MSLITFFLLQRVRVAAALREQRYRYVRRITRLEYETGHWPKEHYAEVRVIAYLRD